MMLPELWNSGSAVALLNHLWQSTAVVLIAWLLTVALRRNAARVRYAVWMFASMKFLVPFALLASLVSQWTTRVPSPQARSAFYLVVEEFSQPIQPAGAPQAEHASEIRPANPFRFAPEFLAAIWMCGFFVVLFRWSASWRRAFRDVKNASSLNAGREFIALRHQERIAKIRRPIPLLLSSRAMEPGIFGVIRPVLLWPAGLSEHLDDAQIHAIVAHEVEHVRRRDNLTSSIHMLVEAFFWFHPAVRWMGSRMHEERERACDETVIEQSSHPDAYAESILKVCTFCLEPPLACVSGVSGSDLKARILRIMTHRSGVALSFGRKLILSAAALLVLAAPIGFGMLHGQASPQSHPDSSLSSDVASGVPKFEVAAIKPSSASDGRFMMMMTPDGTSLRGVSARTILRQAFGVEEDRIIGAPAWVKSDRYDIEAKVAPEDAARLDKLKPEQRRTMLLPLLTERFNLKYHHETRELPMYALVVAKGGPKLTESKPEDIAKPGDGPKKDALPSDPLKAPLGKRDSMFMDPGRLESHGTGMGFLARALAPLLGHTVVNKTGLTGNYDYTLQWTPDNMSPPMGGPNGGPPKSDGGSDTGEPPLFTAIQEQLGLKLESTKGQVDVIVIDHIDQPSAN